MPTGTTELLALARLAVGEGYLALESSPEGLAPDEIRRRLHRYGPNLIAREQQPSLARELWRRASNPLNALLATIATASFPLDDAGAADESCGQHPLVGAGDRESGLWGPAGG